MDLSTLVNLENPQSFFMSFTFVCCLVSMIAGAKVKTFFQNNQIPQSIFLMIIIFVIVGFVGHHAFDHLKSILNTYYSSLLIYIS